VTDLADLSISDRAFARCLGSGGFVSLRELLKTVTYGMRYAAPFPGGPLPDGPLPDLISKLLTSLPKDECGNCGRNRAEHMRLEPGFAAAQTIGYYAGPEPPPPLARQLHDAVLVEVAKP
jgi:hypothetical protein